MQKLNVSISSYLTTKLDQFLKNLQTSSLFCYPYMNGCCAMEYISTVAPHYDLRRFQIEPFHYAPSQCDLLLIMGHVNYKILQTIQQFYDEMLNPKWVIALGNCAATGGLYQNYATVSQLDQIIPINYYLSGCPPRPEAIIDVLLELKKQYANN